VFCGASCAVLWWSAVRSAVVCGGLWFSDLPYWSSFSFFSYSSLLEAHQPSRCERLQTGSPSNQMVVLKKRLLYGPSKSAEKQQTHLLEDVLITYMIYKMTLIRKWVWNLWRCWLGGRKGIRPIKTEWWGVGMVICLECGANNLHMVKLMPLPPHHLLLQ